MRPNGRTVDHVSVQIDAKLNGLTPTPPERCIFRVHHHLRRVNEKAYEPEMLAVGPYHRGKNRLQVMEEHKLRYLKRLLYRREESSVEKYVMVLRGLEERARNCYAEPISLSVDEFVEMMLLDGCFIIELFRQCAMPELRDRCDPIFNMDWILPCLVRDAMLFENQLPFFALHDLFCMTLDPEPLHKDLTKIALDFFALKLPSLRSLKEPRENSTSEIQHLLGLVHNHMLSSFAPTTNKRNAGVLQSIYNFILSSFAPTRNMRNAAVPLSTSAVPLSLSAVPLSTSAVPLSLSAVPQSISCATELVEAGVKFRRVDNRNLFDIRFKNGVLEIPPLSIEDQTESFFRNLIAYEQYRQDNHLNLVTDYVTFMDYLINCFKDVELLCRHRIIENSMGDHKVVATMFNKLGDNVTTGNFRYAEIFKNVNNYCSRSWNVWIAKLRHEYFNNPWALLSFLGAVLLLVLTLTQTIFSILSCFSVTSWVFIVILIDVSHIPRVCNSMAQAKQRLFSLFVGLAIFLCINSLDFFHGILYEFHLVSNVLILL